MIDFRIELSHFEGRHLPWEWVCYDPRDIESTLHVGSGYFETPTAALAAALAYLTNHTAIARFVSKD
jgi:hypothetical protein